ncbi:MULTISPECIES: hypothetical protein [unclassified Pasteurella]|uniref:hypothetical protein n=1 Tax=unclassified Pasteurella TaxID=2621516 RepID=UPI0010746F0D|nr:hypothetical protein [Pasteurella sp. 19428wF3_WM03]TFU51053.1 hypothetical protein E4T92_06735 [Pasteurella sp. WM03]
MKKKNYYKCLEVVVAILLIIFGIYNLLYGRIFLTEEIIPIWNIKYINLSLIASGISLLLISWGIKEGFFKSTIEGIVKYIMFPIVLGGITSITTTIVSAFNLGWFETGFVLLTAGVISSIVIDYIPNNKPFNLLKQIKQKSINWIKGKTAFLKSQPKLEDKNKKNENK